MPWYKSINVSVLVNCVMYWVTKSPILGDLSALYRSHSYKIYTEGRCIKVFTVYAVIVDIGPHSCAQASCGVVMHACAPVVAQSSFRPVGAVGLSLGPYDCSIPGAHLHSTHYVSPHARSDAGARMFWTFGAGGPCPILSVVWV